LKHYLKHFDEFLSEYAMRPVFKNSGGMGINHSYALYFWLKEVQPSIVVESGVWKGATTWLIERASPKSKLLCFDIDYSNLVFKSKNAEYVAQDFSFYNWTDLDLSSSMIIFDDHQNIFERLKLAFFLGFRGCVIEDNYPKNEGDSYSLNHIKLGIGMQSSQLSSRFQGGLVTRVRRKREDAFFRRNYFRQNQIVKPNEYDWANLSARVESIEEFPPIFLDSYTPGGLLWESVVPAPKQNLVLEKPFHDADYSYTYISLLMFKNQLK